MDREYVIRIVLNARDQMAGALSAARAELGAFRASVRGSDGDLAKFGRTSQGVERSIGSLKGRFAELRGSINQVRGPTQGAENDLRRLGRTADDTGRSFGGARTNIARFDNELRGLVLVLATTQAQALTSALVGLAAQLVAVAASALQAGAALGGAFAAGMAQAIPVAGLLAGAFHRVTIVMQAVQQASKAQQAQSVQAVTQHKKESTSANQLANAHDSLASAQDRVKQSQQALADARREGARQLQDLVLAERDAALAARGAALSQTQAQEQLQASIAGGQVSDVAGRQLDVLQSQQGVRRAQLDAIRARQDRQRLVPGGVEGLPQVRQAEASLRSAQQEVERARRGIDQARTNVDAATNAGITQARTLQYLISQLDGAERQLYKSLNKIQEDYKKAFRPITDIIIRSFTDAVNQADKLFKNHTILQDFRGLASEIATAVDHITRYLLSPKVLNFFDEMMGQAALNIPILTDMFIQWGDIFMNIARAGAPALHQLFIDFDNWFKALSESTSDTQALTDFFDKGVQYFEDWIRLGAAVIKLFLAITTGGAAQAGTNTVESLTKTINEATDSIKTHGEQVHQFFASTGAILQDLGRILLSLGQQIAKTFDPGTVNALTDILVKVIIPALGHTFRLFGQITKLLDDIINLPGVGTGAQIFVVFLFMSKLGGTMVDLFRTFRTLVETTFGKVLTGLKEQLGLQEKNTVAAQEEAVAKERTAAAQKVIATNAEVTAAATEASAGASIASGTPLAFQRQSAKNYGATEEEMIAAGLLPPKPTRIPKGLPGAGRFATPEQITAAEFAALPLGQRLLSRGSGVLGRLRGFGQGVGSRAFGGFGAYLGTSIALPIVGNLIGGDAGRQINRGTNLASLGAGAGFALGGLPGAAIGLSAGEIASMAKGEDLSTRDAQAARSIKQIQQALQSGEPKKAQQLLDHLRILRGEVKEENISKIDKFAKSAQKLIDQLNLAPKKTAFEISVDLQAHPNKWKQTIDGFLLQLKGMKPQAARSAEETILALVSGLRKNGDLPAKTAANIRKRVISEYGKMITQTNQAGMASSKAFSNWMENNYNSAGVLAAKYGQNINKILRQMGVTSQMVNQWEIVKNTAALKSGSDQGAGIQQFGPGSFTGGATGGILGMRGERGGDSQLRVLGRGEAVLTGIHQAFVEPALNAFYGWGLGDLFNHVRGDHGARNGFPSGFGMAAGGGVWAGVHDGVRKAAMKLLERFPGLSPPSIGQTTGGGHAANSYHYKGEAVDLSGPQAVMHAASEYIKSSGMYKSLMEGIHNPNLSIHAGAPVGTGFWGADTWAGHTTHIHLAIVGALKAFADQVQQLPRYMVKGHGITHDVMQHTLDRVRNAGNRFIRRQAAKEGAEVGVGKPYDGPLDHTFANQQTTISFGQAVALAKRAGFPDGTATLFGHIATAESGLRPGVVNSIGATGLWQIYNHPDLVARFGDMRNPWHNAEAAYVLWKQGGLQPWVSSRGAWGQFLDTGGEVYGPDGAATPIVAHAGEWVLNKLQQSKIANALGVGRDKLRAALGFTGGPSSFQGGGDVPNIVNPGAAVGGEPQVFAGIPRKTHNLAGKLYGALYRLTRDGGVLDQVATSIGLFTTQLAQQLVKLEFKIGKSGKVIKRISDERVGEIQLENLVNEYDRLVGERSDINEGLKKAHEALKAARTTAGRQKIQTVINNLKKRLTDVTDQIDQNIQDRFDQETSNIQTAVDNITQSGQRKVSQTGIAGLTQRAAAALGRVDISSAFSQLSIDTMNGEISALKKQLTRAQKIGNTSLAQSIQDQIADLQDSIVETTAQMLQNAIDEVNRQASRAQAAVDIANRIADVQEKAGDPVGAARARGAALAGQGANIQNQINALAPLLAQANAQGNVAAAQELADQIADLNTQLVENAQAISDNTVAVRQAQIDQITGRQQFQGGVTQGLTGIVQTLAQISGQPQTQALLQLAQQGQGTLQQTGQSLAGQLLQGYGINVAGLHGQDFVNAISGLNFDQIEQGMTAAQKQQFEALISALIENESALQQNTQQIQELNGQMAAPQTFTSTAWQLFRQAVFTGMGGLLPQYNIPQAADGAYVMSGGLAQLHSDEWVVNKKMRQDFGRSGDININIDHPTEVLDPAYVGKRIAWELNTRR